MTPRLAYDEWRVSRSAKSALQAAARLRSSTGVRRAKLARQLARVLDQSLMIRGNDTGQPERVLLHLRLSELALFKVGVEREPERRNNGKKHQQQQPGLQTRRKTPCFGSRAL